MLTIIPFINTYTPIAIKPAIILPPLYCPIILPHSHYIYHHTEHFPINPLPPHYHLIPTSSPRRRHPHTLPPRHTHLTPTPHPAATRMGNNTCPFDCNSRGKCLPSGRCMCPHNWTGESCDVQRLSTINDCPLNCSFQGQCDRDTHVCKCDPGFQGMYC